MGINKFEYFEQKLNKILDQLDSFCESVEAENRSDNSDIDEIVEKIEKIKTSKEDNKKVTKKKRLLFCTNIQFVLYRLTRSEENFPFLVNFCQT